MLRSSTKLFVQALRTPLVRARSTVAQSVTQGSVCATKDSSQDPVCIGKMMDKQMEGKLPSDKSFSTKSIRQFDFSLCQKGGFVINFNTPDIQREASSQQMQFGKSMNGC